MSFIGNSNGFLDSKIFRKCVLANTNDRLGVIIRTLSEGNGTQTNKTQGLLGMLDSNYKSDVPSTKYAMHLKAIAFESARYLCSSGGYNSDQIFVSTKGEFLYQNIGSFLFPGEQIPQTNDTDVIVRSFYLSIIESYFGGATKTNIEKSLYKFTGTSVILSENFELAKVNESLDSVVSQFVFNVNVDTSDPSIKDVNRLKADIKFLLDLIKPAHTVYQTNFIYKEEFFSESSVLEDFTLDFYDYKYEDLRKKDTNLYSFLINNEIAQREDKTNNVFQASPRVVKTRDQSFLKDSDPSVFHTRHGPIGKQGGQLATEVTDISVFVNGVQVDVLEIYPLSGSFKLSFIPAQTDLVTVTYYYLMKYMGELITNNFDSLLNNLGNAGEFPYKTVLFPSVNTSTGTEIKQLLTSYRYKGYDLFNTSILNDPLNLNFNEVGTRNRINDYHVFKSLGYDQGEYNTTLQENMSLVPMSLDKKDVWRRLPYQELRLNNNEFIMNNPEDRMFGEIHYDSVHPFYSAIEIDSVNNGGQIGIVSSIFEDPTSPMELKFNPFIEPDLTKIGKEFGCSLYTYTPSGNYPSANFYIDGCYPPGYYPVGYSASGYFASGYSSTIFEASILSVLNGASCVLLGGANWEFGVGLDNVTANFGGEYSDYHILVNNLLSETVSSIAIQDDLTGSVQTLWNRDPSENSFFSTLIPASGFSEEQDNRGYLFHLVPDSYTSINPLSATSISPIHLDDLKREFYKKDLWFLSNASLSNSLGQTIASTKLQESDVSVTQDYFENGTPFLLNEKSLQERVFSISSDISGGWLKFLAPKKISSFSNVFNETSGLSFDLTDSYTVNNQVIMLKNNAFNASIFDPLDVIKADIDMFDIMNETDHLVSIFNENYVFYSDINVSSISRLVNYTVNPLGHEYNLAGYYILGSSLIYLDVAIQTEALSKGDLVFAEFVTTEEGNNPSATLTEPRFTRITKHIEVKPV